MNKQVVAVSLLLLSLTATARQAQSPQSLTPGQQPPLFASGKAGLPSPFAPTIAKPDSRPIELQNAYPKVQPPVSPTKTQHTERRVIHQTAAGEQIECRLSGGKPDQCVTRASVTGKIKALTVTSQQDRVLLSSLNFTDPQLKQCLTESANSAGFLYVDQITSLYCFYHYQQPAVSDLTGLKALTELRQFYVGGASANSPLSGLSELTELPHLRDLTLERYQISSLSFLSNIAGLKHLSLHRLKVTAGWQILASLDQLETLRHSDDELSDKPDMVALMNQISGLRSIFLNISNPAAIAGLNHPGIADAYLYDLSNLNFISQLPALNSLTLEQFNHKDIDISALNNHQQLVTLALNGANFTAAHQATIESLPNLMHLVIGSTPNITNLGFVSKLNKLYSLRLFNTANSANLGTLVLPASLKILDLSRYTQWAYSYARIKSVAGLINQPGTLQELDLQGQVGIPCNELDQIASKVAQVRRPASCGVTQTLPEEITVADSRLQACIADFSDTYVEDIMQLSCQDVQQLDGIEQLKNLQLLDITPGALQLRLGSLKPLEKLSSLTDLELSGQQLTDSAANIQYPATLRALNLRQNQLTNAIIPVLQPLLGTLQELTLSSNAINDFSWLSGATTLQHLYIRSTQANNFTFLNQLPNLRSLDIGGHNIGSLSGLSLSAQLNYLNLSMTKLTSLSSVVSALQNPTALTNLYAETTPLTDISHLSALPNLTMLSLYNNSALSDYSVLGSLQQLFWLNLQDNNLPVKFPDFTVPNTLQYLYMTTNKSPVVRDISELIKAAGQFQSLQLQGQLAIDCAQIDTLRNHANQSRFILPVSCGQLAINATTVPDASLRKCLTDSGYGTFTNVTYLYCNANILDWAGVSHMTNLTTVNVSGTATLAQAVQNLAGFNQLSKLQNVMLRGQGLTDSTLLTFSHSGLTYLNLSANPLTQASFAHISQSFPQLQTIALEQTAISGLSNIAALNVPFILLRDNPQITSYSALNNPGIKTIGFYLEPVNSAALTGVKLPAQIIYLGLFGNTWSSIGQIFGLLQQPATLRSLEIDSETLQDLTGLSAASELESLGLLNRHNQALQNFTPVAALPALVSLTINSPTLTTLSPLNGVLSKLWHLDLEDSGVTDFSLLQTMATVDSLWLVHTYIKDLTPLFNLTSLSFLSLQNNSQLSCSQLDMLRSQLPQSVNITEPQLCQDGAAHSFRMRDNSQIQTAEFTHSNDSAKGKLLLSGGKLVFQPAAGLSGWVTLDITVMVNGYSRIISLTTWVDPKVNPAKKAKGLPWWILTAPKAA